MVDAKLKRAWNHDSVAKEALKYSTVGDFKNGSGGAYKYAYRMNIVDTVCAHMKRPNQNRWTNENLKKEAQKYSTTKEFREKSFNAYAAASEKRILHYVCSHMKEFSHLENNDKPIKKLSKIDNAMYQETQETRIELGLPPLEIKVRKCIICKVLFESISDRTCGCLKDHVTSLFGVEVV